ncbi:MAG: AtpZ/AtpI family protein [Oscillospiraceae bacterium]|nr:AtpZ/AtpI family protein [Oscillospiraceae bacterium]
MKELSLIVWLTQLGFSIALPMGGFIWLAVWLRERYQLGAWVIIAGAVLGIAGAVDGLRYSLKAMELMSRDKKEKKTPPRR